MKEKPKYNTLQNVGFMLGMARQVDKSVPFLCAGIAAATAGGTIAQLLLAPAVLARVESHAPLQSLVGVILAFTAVLFVLYGVKAYLDENAIYGRISVRLQIISHISDKMAGTSFSNALDTGFVKAIEKSAGACLSNQDATEAVWQTLTDLLTNLLGFGAYLVLLSGLHPFLLAVVAVTTVAGYLVSLRTNRWIYQHREEEEEYSNRMSYLRRSCTDRANAKDIRLFGLQPWLNEVWERVIRLFGDYVRRRELHYLWIDGADLVLTFARDGIAYAYLIWLALTEGLPASQFLLYFTAVSGFTQWVRGILDKGATLHRQSLEISRIRETLDWPEPFRLAGGKPLPRDPNLPCEIRFDHVSYRYPEADKDTLHDIDLTIHAGEKLAIVGLNGAGKTTLVRLSRPHRGTGAPQRPGHPGLQPAGLLCPFLGSVSGFFPAGSQRGRKRGPAGGGHRYRPGVGLPCQGGPDRNGAGAAPGAGYQAGPSGVRGRGGIFRRADPAADAGPGPV